MPSTTKLFFTGEETMLLHQELKKYTNAFLSKYGDSGYRSFRGENFDSAQIQNELIGGGMFSTKKLIIIWSVPKDTHPTNKIKDSEQQKTEERIIKHRTDIPDEHIVIFVSYKPDKRTKGVKFFLEQATVKEFALLDEKKLAIKAQELLGNLLAGNIATKLIEWIGKDGGVGTLINECTKLMHYAQSNQLTALTLAHIYEVCTPASESKAFALMDNIFVHPDLAIQNISDAEQAGEEHMAFLGGLYRGIKLIIATLESYQSGHISLTDIAKDIAIHHFPVGKALKHIAIYTAKIDAIKSCFTQILQLDYQFKNGLLPIDAFWLEIKRVIFAV